MATPFYAQPSLNIELYDERADAQMTSAGDVAFYDELARRTGGPVLELACGTGRVAWRLAAKGHVVVGLDLSEGMLARASKRLEEEPDSVRARLDLVRGDMSAFDLGHQFGLVLIAFRSFQMLLTPDQERACLTSIRKHLRPDGLVAIDIFDPRLDLCLPEEASSPARSGLLMHDGNHPATANRVTIEVLSRTNDPLRQLLEECWRFTEYAPDGRPLRQEDEVLQLRWIYRWEMRYLLEACGFEIVAEYSDFQRSPPAYGKEQVWVATPA